MHCILSANHHISWNLPTGQNGINWTPEGQAYIIHLYHLFGEQYYRNLDLFTKALLTNDFIIPPDYLYSILTEKQRDIFNRYYWSYTDEMVLPMSMYGNLNYIRSIVLNESLWIGAGYDPRDYTWLE